MPGHGDRAGRHVQLLFFSLLTSRQLVKWWVVPILSLKRELIHKGSCTLGIAPDLHTLLYTVGGSSQVRSSGDSEHDPRP